jgi:uncharacterized protein
VKVLDEGGETVMAETTYIDDRVANPWVLGLYGLAGATFVVGTRLAGWYGSDTSGRLLAPVLAVFGIVQLLAAMWSFARRDDLATAILGVWGAFWLGYGIVIAPRATSAPPAAIASPELAFWFIVLAAITWMSALAATAESWALVGGLVVLAAAATLAAIGDGIGSHGFRVLSGWLFAIAGVVAWYTSTALMLAASRHREVLPLGMAPLARATPAPGTDIPRPVPTAARRVS